MGSNTTSIQDENRLCKVCGQGQAQFWLIAKGYQIGKCTQCGFAQVLNVPSANELSLLYETLPAKHAKYRSNQSAKLENQRRLKLLTKYVADGCRVLDAGCATGDFLVEATEAFVMYGLDISSTAITRARHRLPQLYNRLTAQRLQDLDPSWRGFDAVCLWDVIEHVADPVMVIHQMMDRLKPGGYLFMSTPDSGSLMAGIMRSYWAFMIPPYHLGYFSERSFRYLFNHRVSGDIVYYNTKGKTVDLTFLAYKLNQISHLVAPKFLLDWLTKNRLGRLRLYIPTNDIAYLAVRKPDPLNLSSEALPCM